MGTRRWGIYSVEDITSIIEGVILWYKENGLAKERLGAVIDRIGIDALESALASGALLERKDEILAAPINE